MKRKIAIAAAAGVIILGAGTYTAVAMGSDDRPASAPAGSVTTSAGPGTAAPTQGAASPRTLVPTPTRAPGSAAPTPDRRGDATTPDDHPGAHDRGTTARPTDDNPGAHNQRGRDTDRTDRTDRTDDHPGAHDQGGRDDSRGHGG